MKAKRSSSIFAACLFLAGFGICGEPSIELVDASPGPWSTVDETVVLHATIRYDLGEHEIAEGIYSIFLQFGTVIEGQTALPGEPVFSDKPPQNLPDQMKGVVKLREPRGEVELSYPLELVRWRREITLPLQINFFLLKKTGDNSSSVVAKTEPFEYPVASSW